MLKNSNSKYASLELGRALGGSWAPLLALVRPREQASGDRYARDAGLQGRAETAPPGGVPGGTNESLYWLVGETLGRGLLRSFSTFQRRNLPRTESLKQAQKAK